MSLIFWKSQEVSKLQLHMFKNARKYHVMARVKHFVQLNFRLRQVEHKIWPQNITPPPTTNNQNILSQFEII